MNEVERYIQAGTRENTRRSYQSAIEHFEVSWGGFLPASSESILRYLAAHAGTLAYSTLKQRLAALAQWHVSQGFPAPTKAPAVRQVLKGIRTLHPAQPRQAAPMQLQHLEQAASWLEREAIDAALRGERAALLRCRRDAALLLIGFWRAFRSDELCRLRIEDIRAEAGNGMSLFLPYAKGDREHRGTTYQAPALARLCPVEAYLNWLSASGLRQGPVFRRIDRWGNLAEDGLHANSLIALLRQILGRAGIAAGEYSSHSLRRGFATWATLNGWDLKALMSYVGWKDASSAMRYIDPAVSFGGLALRPVEAAVAPRELPSPRGDGQ